MPSDTDLINELMTSNADLSQRANRAEKKLKKIEKVLDDRDASRHRKLSQISEIMGKGTIV